MDKEKKNFNQAMVNSVVIRSDSGGASEAEYLEEEGTREFCYEESNQDELHLNEEEVEIEEEIVEEEMIEEGEAETDETDEVELEEALKEEKENRAYNKKIDCPDCDKGLFRNCAECCNVVEKLCEEFGYQKDVECECHDICVQDVKLICVKFREITIPVAGLDDAIGCRGGVEITGVPRLDSCRIFCAEESLRTEGPERCLVIDNEVGVEVTLRIKAYPRDIILVHKAIDKFACKFFEFKKFPKGDGFPKNLKGARDFKEEIKFIDGSCKTVIIEKCKVENTECPRVEVKLKVIDKLWKHENLLVSALKPYPKNITIKEEFNELHKIGPCPPPCP